MSPPSKVSQNGGLVGGGGQAGSGGEYGDQGSKWGLWEVLGRLEGVTQFTGG